MSQPFRVQAFADGGQGIRHLISNRASLVPSGLLLPGAEFDELFLGNWLHIEQMDRRDWWMAIGETHVNVHLTRDWRIHSMTIEENP